MSKDKISDYSATANSNTDIAGINIDEGCAPSGINNAIRTLMKQLKDWQSGSQDVYITPAGSVSAPAVTTTGDTNTGVYFPAADKVAIATGGVAAVTVDSSQNVGIGTSSPATKLDVVGTGVQYIGLTGQSTTIYMSAGSSGCGLFTPAATPMTFGTNSAERARIDSSGNLLVGTTSTLSGNLPSGKIQVLQTGTTGHGASFQTNSVSGFAAAAFSRNGNNGAVCEFLYNPSTTVGSVSVTSSTTTYNTSSDYRLKENVQPMTGALAVIHQLKPCTYKWKIDGSDGQGFIAHELQEVVPDCVTGEKDAVDADGNPIYQGIDTSFLVATLTAAIQELSSKNDALEARLAALETK